MARAPLALPAVFLTFLLLCPEAAADPPAGDKALHVLLGASCALLASAIAAPALQDPSLADARYALGVSAAGLSAAVLAGVLKELLDMAGFGKPEWLDLAATAAGGLVASAAVFAAAAADPQARLAPVYASFGIALALPPAAELVRRLSSRRNSASAE